MTKNKLALLAVLSLCVFIVGLAASAGGRGSGGPSVESTEVVIGNYHCGVEFGNDRAYSWVDLNGTGDLFSNYFSLNRNFAVDPATAETCDAPAVASAELIKEAGCSVSPVEIATYTDDDGIALDFQFICHGSRSEIIAAIARIGEHLMTEPQ